MKNFGQVLRGLLVGLASLALVIGGLSLSLAEGRINLLQPPTAPASTDTASASPSLTGTFSPTFTPSVVSPTTTASATETFTPTLTPPESCPPPQGWVAYAVKSGDTLASLATRFHTTAQALQQGNCLKTADLTIGEILYVPPMPTATRVPCGAPAGWVTVIIQPNDTLYHFSVAYGVTIEQLQLANCMGTSTTLVLGESFFVPPWATRTPSEPILTPPTEGPTATFTPYETPTFTPTEPGFFPSDTPTWTRSP